MNSTQLAEIGAIFARHPDQFPKHGSLIIEFIFKAGQMVRIEHTTRESVLIQGGNHE
jgi:hypothetical protein